MTLTQPALDNSARQYLEDAIAHSSSPNQHLLPLTARIGKGDRLEIGGCDVVTLVERFGSPLYILDETTLRTACQQYREALRQYYPGDSLVLFASKAWSCLAVCAIAASEGLGIDVVSGGELYTALAAGVAPVKLYLHGNNKSLEEIQLAIDNQCTVVADNWMDLQAIAQQPHPVRVMLRFTPGIECHTHEYIRTGHLDSKFGFDPEQLTPVLEFVQKHSHLNCIGLHAHIGSQIFELQPHQDLATLIVRWYQQARDMGLPVTELNVGGGLGIRYTEADDPPSISEWVRVIAEGIVAACEAQGQPLPRLLCEPGRSLVGSACVTAYTVGSQKQVPDIRTYIAVDGGMSDNPRPITYQSQYRCAIANRMSAPFTQRVTVAGKHCESGDVLIRDAALPEVNAGDVLVVASTGAYNYSMASNYNRLPKPAAVLVQDGDAKLFLRRETYQDLVRQDMLPERLECHGEGDRV
ncbi:MAG: diaminopimelate decarboxylase [Coleofasciculaceae cyanobacterium SM2_3_26]|nr:diaminopimelate decarboxylase [Coleofasciculaceae cyanobacterium SM2_3_26]